MKLTDKTSLITGGGRGIGRAIALAMAAEGANVVISARGAAELTATAELISSKGGHVLAVTADVSKPEEVEELFLAAKRRFGGVDILVNNAGMQGPIGPAEEVDTELWLQTVSVNLSGTWLCMKAAIPGMKSRGHGKIINLSGGGATGPRERFSAYASSKAAVVRLTETVAQELQGSGIDVNSIAPGAVNTAMLDEVLEAGELAGEELDAARKRADEGGTSPEKAAALTVFLASSASDGITGKLLSAVWDPWDDESFADKLRSDGDLATLRRIDDRYYSKI